MTEALSPTQREHYDAKGYVIIPGLHDPQTISSVRRLIYLTSCRFVPTLADQTSGEARPWESMTFDDAVRELYATDDGSFSALSDSLQNAAILNRVASAQATFNTVAALLGEDVDGLAMSGLQLRIDVPNDPKNTHGWHQERAYYPQNAEGHRGLVMSVALQDTPADLGALRVSPGSHRDGFTHPHEQISGDNVEQKNLPSEALEERSEVDTAYNRGDALFVGMNTFHRAGRNRGERVRFTLLCRYHQLLADPMYVATRTRLEANPLLRQRAEDAHGPLF